MSRLNNNTIISPYQIPERKESSRSQRVFIDSGNQALVYKTGGEVDVFIDAENSAIEFDMPDAESSFERFNLIRTDETLNTVTVNGIDGQQIVNKDYININACESASLISDGQNWWIK